MSSSANVDDDGPQHPSQASPAPSPDGRGGPAGASADVAEQAVQTRVQSVSRAAALLMIVAGASESGYSAKEISDRLGTKLPTTYHLLNTLLDANMVSRDANRQFRLGHGVGVLADGYYRQSAPPPSLLGPLQALTETTGETAYLSAWRRGELEILAVRSGTHAVRVMNLTPGFHDNAHARASGKLLLALGSQEVRQRYLEQHPLNPMTKNTITDLTDFVSELDAIVLKGYAADEEEFYEGVSCMAIPIVQDGFLLGAYTLSAPVSRYRANRLEYLEQLRAAARDAVRPSTEPGEPSIAPDHRKKA